MENASKALLIAGSVLIAILLIAFGVRTFNSTKGTTESVQTTMSATEKATFNNKFAGYTGTLVPRAKLKALANLIIANNASNSAHQVYFGTVGKTGASDIQSAAEGLTAATYTVNAQLDPDTGLVIGITYS